MRGLFAKDLALISQRKQTLLIFVVIALFMGFTMDATFVVTYISILAGIMSISTLSYDNLDNGYPFLFTLPVTRKDYVKEKYLFCLSIATAGWFAASILFFIINTVKGIAIDPSEDIMGLLLVLPMVWIITSFSLGFQIRFGAEKSRYMMMAVIGAIFAIGYAVLKVFDVPDEVLDAFFEKLMTVSPTLIVYTISLIICIACFLWSLRTMEKKEF